MPIVFMVLLEKESAAYLQIKHVLPTSEIKDARKNFISKKRIEWQVEHTAISDHQQL